MSEITPLLGHANPTHPSSNPAHSSSNPMHASSSSAPLNTSTSPPSENSSNQDPEGFESSELDYHISNFRRPMRDRSPPTPPPEDEIPEKRVVIAMDDTEFCYGLLRWTLDHLFSVKYPFATPRNVRARFRFKIVIAHAQRLPISLYRFCGAGSSEYIQLEENDRSTQSENIVRRAKEICTEKGVHDPTFDIRSGDVEKVLLEVAIHQEAIILVVGSHGCGFMKRLLVGSVANSCARKAKCAVMIVKEAVINQPDDRELIIGQPPGRGPEIAQPPRGDTQIDQPPGRESEMNPQPEGSQQGN